MSSLERLQVKPYISATGRYSVIQISLVQVQNNYIPLFNEIKICLTSCPLSTFKRIITSREYKLYSSLNILDCTNTNICIHFFHKSISAYVLAINLRQGRSLFSLAHMKIFLYLNQHADAPRRSESRP